MATASTSAQQSTEFIGYVEEWLQRLQPFSLRDELREPEQTAIFSADMVGGFCSQGNLASPRIASLVPTIVDIFRSAHDLGVRHFILAQDTHSEDALEFGAFPPHCLRDTEEAQTIPELQALPFSDLFTVVEKNSLHPSVGTTLDPWLDRHPELKDLIVVGDCTDLCTYALAMHLRLRANAYGLKDQRVIVPANAVDTYDMSIEAAAEIGAMPHPADLFHSLFLYHMGLNGVQVVSRIS